MSKRVRLNLDKLITEKISARQTLDLRGRILRPGQTQAECRYAEDDLASTFHLGVLLDTQVIANGTFIQQAHEKFSRAKLPYRLRGMATDNAFQKKGLGSLIINAGLIELQKKNCDLLWFNARTSAENFYRKLGFEKLDFIFDIPGIGPHKIMFKWLTVR